MLPIVDRPLIEWVLGRLGRQGVDEAVLSLGYRPTAFVDAYPDGVCAGVKVSFAVDPEPLGTAGGIKHAAIEAGIDERFVAVNGDVLTDLDLSSLLGFHSLRDAEATISLHRVADPSRFGVVPTDDQGRVTAFVEKPPAGQAVTDLINGGTYVLEPSVLDRIPLGRPVSIERETFPEMVAEGTLYALSDNGVYWLDTGTPEQYLQAQLDVLDGLRGEPPRAVAAGAYVSAGAFVARSVVQRGARIENGASVVDSVVMAGVEVGRAAEVAMSVLAPGVLVGAGAVLTDVVLGDGVAVGAGERLAGVRIPDPSEGEEPE
jgi:NDP-sugar pyrophosphorylase family protein